MKLNQKVYVRRWVLVAAGLFAIGQCLGATAGIVDLIWGS